MIRKGLAAFVVLVALVEGVAQTTSPPKNSEGAIAPVAQDSPAAVAPARRTTFAKPVTSADPAPSASPVTTASPLASPSPVTSVSTAEDPKTTNPVCPDGNCEPPQRITIATPVSASPIWQWQERVAWGANIVLAILGYIGIMLALSTLRKIERQTRYGEEAAQAATESAQAALLHAQAMARAQRPWIMVTSEPSAEKDHAFSVFVTNRGRSPARIERCLDAIATAADDDSLPANPALSRGKQANPVDGMILLPGESTSIRVFDRDEISNHFETEMAWKNLVSSAVKVYLYGKVTYRDLAEPDNAEPHVSGWCLCYVPGRQKSALVQAGPQAYNKHT